MSKSRGGYAQNRSKSLVTVGFVALVALAGLTGCSTTVQVPSLSTQDVNDIALDPATVSSPVPRDSQLVGIDSSRIAAGIDAVLAAEPAGIASFSAADDADAARSSVMYRDLPAVQAALDAYADAGYEAGFIMCDLNTGKGFAANADGAFFAASTIKASYVASIAELLDANEARADEVLEKDLVMEGTGIMAFDDAQSYALSQVMTDTIVYSDNTGYALLRERFGDEGYATWAASCGVDASTWEGEWYPSFCPADVAKLWLGMRDYFVGGTPNAGWVEELFAQTNTSFIRQVLGARASVLSKAGYEMSSDFGNTSALNDAGIVVPLSGHPYLLVVMSNADYDDEYYTDNEVLIKGLIEALDNVRGQLNEA